MQHPGGCGSQQWTQIEHRTLQYDPAMNMFGYHYITYVLVLSGRISVSLNITLFSCSMSHISLNRLEPGVALKPPSMHT